MTKQSNNSGSFSKSPIIPGLIRAFSIDYRTLALFRVCAGTIILVDILLRSRDFTAFFTDHGVIPRKLALYWWPADGTFSVYFINGGAFFNAALVVFTVILALALIVGYRTRLVTVLSWVMLVSLHQRTSILSDGGEDLLRLLLFWGMFLPLGARFSFDAAMETSDPYPDRSIFGVATFGILMQAMYVYWVGALLKTGDAWNIDHSAVFYALKRRTIHNTGRKLATGTPGFFTALPDSVRINNRNLWAFGYTHPVCLALSTLGGAFSTDMHAYQFCDFFECGFISRYWHHLITVICAHRNMANCSEKVGG